MSRAVPEKSSRIACAASSGERVRIAVTTAQCSASELHYFCRTNMRGGGGTLLAFLISPVCTVELFTSPLVSASATVIASRVRISVAPYGRDGSSHP